MKGKPNDEDTVFATEATVIVAVGATVTAAVTGFLVAPLETNFSN